MPLALDLESYARDCERFVGEMDREYYLHFAGHKEDFEIEQIYEEHADLFQREVVADLREQLSSGPEGEERRVRYLLELAVGGLLGRETKREEAELAEREAALELEVNGDRLPYRQSAVTQANEADPGRRAAIEEARLQALDSELNKLHLRALERAHEVARELGWSSYRDMNADLKRIDLEALERQTTAFLDATSGAYAPTIEPHLRSQVGLELGELRRSDLPYFFRARGFDGMFPAGGLVAALRQTLAGLGIALDQQQNVRLDTEQRPLKSPRAFCAPVRVPDEIYLVISPQGGRDDYAAMFHEAGHAEHYAHVDPSMPFEYRHLGDNSVTEGFAFLLEHLTEDPAWLEATLGVTEVEEYAGYVRASKLVFLRRYAAKLSYELQLHGGERPLSEMPDTYAGLLGDALSVDWPSRTWLSDVDPGFYVANYLRAWAFETRLRHLLRERFGREWFSEPAAGDLLRDIWREGQRLDADELLAQATGERIDFSVMLDEV
jgi:hypothetical protein